MATTDLEFATLFADSLDRFKAGTITEALLATEFANQLSEWAGTPYTKASIAKQIAGVIANYSENTAQVTDWWSGSVDGGPNNDGLYPFTNSLGVTTYLPCPATVLNNATDGAVATVLDAQAVVLAAAQTATEMAAAATSAAEGVAQDAATASAAATTATNNATAAVNAAGTATNAAQTATTKASDAQAAANIATNKAAESVVSRDEALQFRDEAEQFRNQAQAISGGDFQTHDPTLDGIAALNIVANRIVYTTGVDTFGLAALSAYMRGLLATTDAEALKTALAIDMGDVGGLQAALDDKVDVSDLVAVTDRVTQLEARADPVALALVFGG